jgi:5-formyltetrahydrofolate cyclo-ligase
MKKRFPEEWPRGTLKESVRARVKSLRADLADDEVAEASEAIAGRVLGLPECTRAAAAGCYLSIGKEVKTERIMAACRATGKAVAVPAWDRERCGYRWAWMEDGASMRRGFMGIEEPAEVRWADAGALDIVLVPGLAFDRRGGRIGHGAGHFDRILAGGCSFKVGLSLALQVWDWVPTSEQDVAMNAVVTEAETIRCAVAHEARCAEDKKEG